MLPEDGGSDAVRESSFPMVGGFIKTSSAEGAALFAGIASGSTAR